MDKLSNKTCCNTECMYFDEEIMNNCHDTRRRTCVWYNDVRPLYYETIGEREKRKN